MTEERSEEPSGPFLLVACLCENVVQRADLVLTLVNIIDRLNITSQGTGATAEMPPTTWQGYLVIIMKAGKSRARLELKTVLQLPDGSTKAPVIMSVNFEGEDDRGIQIIQRVAISLTAEGLYWFKLYLGGAQLTRLPLRVTYSHVTGSSLMGPPPGIG